MTETLAHTIIIDETRCQPQLCPGGICRAKKVCPYKCILQYDPGDVPVANSAHCNGCAVCTQRCPAQAVTIVWVHNPTSASGSILSQGRPKGNPGG